MKKLTIIDTFGNINAFSLDDSGTSRYYLGRTDIRSSGEKNDIVIPSPTISREHGKFKVEDGRVLYADLNSLNGTICESDGQQQYLHGNSKYIQLQPGDMLRVQPRESRADNSVLIIYTDSTETGSWRKFSLMTPTVKIGSDMNNDIVLPVGSASPLHAVIEKSGTGYRITSGRGEGRIFLNGKKIQNGADLHEKDVVRIGDSTLIFSNDAIFFVSELEGIRIEARNLSLTVGKDHHFVFKGVSCSIDSNSFVAIAGRPGEEKNALLDALSGFDKEYKGDIWFDGIHVRENFEELKPRIGYVPMEDIVYDDLKLGRMLWLTAKLRLPKGTSKEKVEERLDKVLNMMEMSEYRNIYIRDMSLEQRRRANIAVELLTDPGVLFLNEPTYGLDPGAELNLMIILNRLAKSQGITVVMASTHAPQNLQLCDKILFLDNSGLLCFEGTVRQAEMFFGAQNLSDIYNRISEDPEEWSAQYRNAVSQGRAAANSPSPELDPYRYARNARGGGYSVSYHKGNGFTEFFKGFHISQVPTLISRSMEVITNNWKKLLLLFGQPLAIALVLILLAHQNILANLRYEHFYLSIIRTAAIWLGLFDSVRAINRERSILRREYMGNLSIGAYIMAKYIVLSIVALLQALIMTGIFAIFTDWPNTQYLYRSMYPEILISIWLTIIASIGLGLVVSCLIRRPEYALLASPFILIIQIFLSGEYSFFITSGEQRSFLGRTGEFLSNLTISKWSLKALECAYTYYVDFILENLWWWNRGSFALYNADAFWKYWKILILMIAISIILCVFLIHWIIKRKR